MKGGCRLKRRKKLSKTLLSESSSDSSGEELSKEYLDESRRTKRAKVDLTSDSSEEVSFSPKLLVSLIDNIFGLFFRMTIYHFQPLPRATWSRRILSQLLLVTL